MNSINYNDKFIDPNLFKNISPLQAEKNEWIMLPDGSLVKSAAKKTHKQMDKDEVTDVIPDQSYIFSNDKKFKLKKEDLSDLVIGKELLHYQEGKVSKPPKDIKFSEIFGNKKSATPAELINNIEKKYKVETDSEHKYNPYIQKANDFNKETRQKYVLSTLALNEALKMKYEKNKTEPVKNESNKFGYGGYKYQYGGEIFQNALSGATTGASIGSVFSPVGTLIGGGIGLIGGVGAGLFNANRLKKERDINEKRRQEYINSLKDNYSNSYKASMLSTAGKLLLPTPKYNYLNLDNQKTRTENEFDKIFKSYESRKSDILNSGNAMANTAVRNLSNSGLSNEQLQNVASSIYGNNIKNYNTNALNLENNRDNLRLNKLQTLNNYDTMLSQDEQRGKNYLEEYKNSKYMNAINELNTNYQNNQSKLADLESLKYSSKNSLDSRMASESANSFGRINNTLSSLKTIAPLLNDNLKGNKNLSIEDQQQYMDKQVNDITNKIDKSIPENNNFSTQVVNYLPKFSSNSKTNFVTINNKLYTMKQSLDGNWYYRDNHSGKFVLVK